MELAYINIFVSDLNNAVSFYRQKLGLSLITAEPDFGYAAFLAGAVKLGFARATSYDRRPQQPWGGYMATLEDPDGNRFYLDQTGEMSN